ncbi:hypothetical protein, partial [Veillonella sp. VA142]|uniref:beta strand repeat-containing protein n=1 Tax=Veillonella sp. VA142 TaxID=741834 RepID=UPI00197EF9D7
ANGIDGRDGKSGIASGTTAAGMGAQGPTGQDGLNGKDLTTKVNALRNGEAGTVVYTDAEGNRLVKANDGNYYKADQVDKDGNVITPAGGTKPTATTDVQARLVNPDGTTTGGTTKLSNIADGEIKAGSTDAINGGQLHSKLAEKADKSDITTINNTLAGKASASDLNTLAEKTLTFSGDTGTNATRKLGETLAVKGAANFTPTATATPGVNIQVASDPTNGLTVSLADTLTNMKGISGDGQNDLVIKNGTNTITVTPNTAEVKNDAGVVTKKADPGTVNFGGAKLITSSTAEGDTDVTNKKYVDDAISKVNTTVAGNATLNFAGNVTKDEHDADTTKVGLPLSTGVLKVQGNANTKDIVTTAQGDTIIIGLHQDVKDQLAKLGNTVADGRDGKAGTGKDPKATDATAGDKGLTGQDGLNGKDLTTKVNALRNGEAGTVVYTDAEGNRLVKANDGNYYKADQVDKDGNVITPAGGTKPTAATDVQARLVNPDGTTTIAANTTGTKLSNIADGTIAASSHDAVTGGQLYTAKSELATALGGNASVDTNGALTGPTYSITKDDAAGGTDTVNNVGAAVSKLDSRINTVKGMAEQPLTFTGDDKKDVTRALGTTLTVKGAENFTPVTAPATATTGTASPGTTTTATTTTATTTTATTTTATPEGTNIRVEKDPTTDANGLVVKLADTLTKMKGISGNGTNDLVIKNGDNTVITVKAGATGTKGDVDFGGSKLTNIGTPDANTDAANKAYVDSKVGGVANLGYKANTETGRTVAVTTGLTFKSGTGTIDATGTDAATTNTATTKTGIAISTEDGGIVNIGLDANTRTAIDKVATLESAIGKSGVDGRDGKSGIASGTIAAGMGAQGPTGQDGLNG